MLHGPVEVCPVESSQTFFKKVALPEKVVWLFLFTVLVLVRVPDVLLGRFWAEEGRVFFQNGWNLPWYQALFTSYGGYLNIAANLAGVIANYLAPLERACFVSTIFALIIQMFPFVLLCLSNQLWLQNRKILLAAMLVISTMPMTQEIWLSSIGSQCHLNLCVALILVLETREGLVGYFHKALLFFTPLTGPGSIALIPFFFLRAVLDRSIARAMQGGILLAGAAIQLLFFWHFGSRGTFGIEMPLLLNVVYVKHLLGPFLGFEESKALTPHWDRMYLNGQLDMVPGMLMALMGLGLLLFLAIRSRKAEPVWMVTVGIVLAALSYLGSLGDRSILLDVAVSERYDFAPQVLFDLSLLFSAFYAKGITKTLSQALIVWLVIIGVHEYFETPPWYATGPRWRHEVYKWRKNPAYMLRAWPTDWSFNLKPHDKP
jgi:succinate dehydrogenase hydrophobic anchor subunit